MKRIIEEILEVEEQLKTVVTEARAEAAAIKNSADKDMSEKLNQAKEQTRHIYQTTVDQAKKQAEQLAAEKLRQADMQKDAMFKENADKINRLVEDICRIIVKTEYDMDSK